MSGETGCWTRVPGRVNGKTCITNCYEPTVLHADGRVAGHCLRHLEEGLRAEVQLNSPYKVTPCVVPCMVCLIVRLLTEVTRWNICQRCGGLRYLTLVGGELEGARVPCSACWNENVRELTTVTCVQTLEGG